MNERTADSRLDRELAAFLAWQSDDIGGAPSASEMAIRIRDRLRPPGLALLDTHRQQLAFALLLTALIALLLAVAGLVGSRPPLLTSVQNGWIAYSTQPGYAQTFDTDWAQGGDIYLVREGVDPRIIVERGPEMKRNVCPQFSPDGSRLVYGELAGATAAMVLLEVSDAGAVSEWRRFTLPGPSAVAPCPRWSGGGTRLAYLDGGRWSTDGVPDGAESVVRVVNLDGDPIEWTEDDPTVDALRRGGPFDPMGPADASLPLESPDGELRARCAGDDVVVGPPDGSADRRVVRGCGYSIAAWSPDSSKLLLMSDGGRHATMSVTSLSDPSSLDHIAPYIPVNGLRSWPGRGDVSWQSVFR